MDLNNCCFSGRIVDDAKLDEKSGGFPIVSFSLAINETRKSKQKEHEYYKYASFIDCVFFGNYAKAIVKGLKRGTYITISCRLRQERWIYDNKNYKRIVFIVNELAFLSERKKENNDKLEQFKTDNDGILNTEEPKELTNDEVMESGLF